MERQREREGERRGGEKLDSNNPAVTFFLLLLSFLSVEEASGKKEKKEEEEVKGDQSRQTDSHWITFASQLQTPLDTNAHLLTD